MQEAGSPATCVEEAGKVGEKTAAVARNREMAVDVAEARGLPVAYQGRAKKRSRRRTHGVSIPAENGTWRRPRRPRHRLQNTAAAGVLQVQRK